jgi:hypothetical protein
MKQIAVATGIFAAMVFLLALWLAMKGGPRSVNDWAFLALLMGATMTTCVLVLGDAGRRPRGPVRES